MHREERAVPQEDVAAEPLPLSLFTMDFPLHTGRYVQGDNSAATSHGGWTHRAPATSTAATRHTRAARTGCIRDSESYREGGTHTHAWTASSYRTHTHTYTDTHIGLTYTSGHTHTDSEFTQGDGNRTEICLCKRPIHTVVPPRPCLEHAVSSIVNTLSPPL